MGETPPSIMSSVLIRHLLCQGQVMETATMQTASELLPTFNNAQAWYGSDMIDRSDWIHELDAQEIAELDDAIAIFEKNGVELVGMRREDFPLPTLAHRLEDLKQQLLNGRGFML